MPSDSVADSDKRMAITHHMPVFQKRVGILSWLGKPSAVTYRTALGMLDTADFQEESRLPVQEQGPSSVPELFSAATPSAKPSGVREEPSLRALSAR